MNRKKFKLLLALSVLCLICVLSEAYLKGYITLNDVKETSKNIVNQEYTEEPAATEKPEVTKEPAATEKPEVTKEPAATKRPEATKEPANTKKPAATKKPLKPGPSQNVRILIMSDGFGSYYHNSISLTCDSGFNVTDGNKTTSYKAGKKVSFNTSKKGIKKKKFIISPANNSGIKILSFKRRDIHPVYSGSMEIKWTKKGFLMVNELPLEKYLYAVVPSEMPTESGMEALKAQAVCARSYAYNQIREKRYKAYNADLDDSVACQVYNNIPSDKRSKRAVDETYGQVVTRKGEIIVTYYFATSWGCTADGQDVWNTPDEVPYLRGALQTRRKNAAGTDSINLSDEKAFRDFINSDNNKTYDSGDDWYRWNVTLSAANLSNRIDSALYNCYLSDKSLVLTQNKNGKYVQKPLKSIGKIKKLRVEKRQESGLVTELVIVGTNNVVKVCTQYNIRKVLAPVYERINRKGGESISSYSMLPSAAFYIDEKHSKKSISFKITGGGFGHGAGLSQTGAAAMAESGEGYDTILKHYFRGTKIQNIKKVSK